MVFVAWVTDCAGGVGGAVASTTFLRPTVPTMNTVDRITVATIRLAPVITRVSLTFLSPSNYQVAVMRLNEGPPIWS